MQSSNYDFTLKVGDTSYLIEKRDVPCFADLTSTLPLTVEAGGILKYLEANGYAHKGPKGPVEITGITYYPRFDPHLEFHHITRLLNAFGTYFPRFRGVDAFTIQQNGWSVDVDSPAYWEYIMLCILRTFHEKYEVMQDLLALFGARLHAPKNIGTLLLGLLPFVHRLTRHGEHRSSIHDAWHPFASRLCNPENVLSTLQAHTIPSGVGTFRNCSRLRVEGVDALDYLYRKDNESFNMYCDPSLDSMKTVLLEKPPEKSTTLQYAAALAMEKYCD